MGKSSKPLTDESVNAAFSRFMLYVDTDGSESGCWIWIGNRSRQGYGQIWLDGSPRQAHRISYYLHYGRSPGEMHVCHKCDNPSCVNPDHLFLGTNLDNMRDRQKKGGYKYDNGRKDGTAPEWAAGSANGRSTHPQSAAKGESHGRAKLTEADVIEIRALYRDGKTYMEIAGQKFISRTAVRLIVKGLRWKHIP